MKRLLFLFLFPVLALAQPDIALGGYMKLLGTFNNINSNYLPDGLPPFAQPLFPTSSQDYQVHNRIKFKWYLPKGFTVGVGMRNRLFWGYQVRSFDKNPVLYQFLGMNSFADLIEFDTYFDLSIVWWENENTVLHTVFDRLWLDWESKNLRVRLGRQRINWGINTYFNPNDLFNQYNFFDFDYEERPGVDAALVQYYISPYSSLEAAFTPGVDSIQQSVGALLYRLNKFQYDWQVLAGYFKQDVALGFGWAGNLKNAGFKGESTYFLPIDDQVTEANFVSSITLDYSLKNGLYVMGGYLFNDNGNDDASVLNLAFVSSAQLTAKNIFPYKHSIMLQFGKDITPLFRADISWIQTPNFANGIAVPSFTYSIMSNLDLLLLGQLFFTNHPDDGHFGFFSSSIFTRLKYSF